MIKLDEVDIARRTPVWHALSELFVGKELQDYDYRYIAEVLQQSGYAPATLQDILVDEVAPVFQGNLGTLAIPELEGWTAETVKSAILESLQASPRMMQRLLPEHWLRERRLVPVKKRWEVVRAMLGA